jgi:hypothetical protein
MKAGSGVVCVCVGDRPGLFLLIDRFAEKRKGVVTQKEYKLSLIGKKYFFFRCL